MRIAIREQLATLVIVAVLVSLAIVAVPTWIYVHNFVVDVESDALLLTASLKAARISSELQLTETLCKSIASRILLQESLVNFYNANSTDPFGLAEADLEGAMSTGGPTGLYQAKLYSRNSTGNPNGLLFVSGNGLGNQTKNIELPYLTPDGARANLSDTPYGYPPSLYPNITYLNLGYPNPFEPSTPAYAAIAFPDVWLSTNGGLILGPLVINESFALISMTIPIRSLRISRFILGYLTVIASANSLIAVQSSREGLGNTGMVLLLGPANPWGRFNASLPPTNDTYSPPYDDFAQSSVRFLLPPVPNRAQADRHMNRSFGDGGFSTQFPLSQYPALLDDYYQNSSQPNHADSILSATNEEGVPVAVGVARPQSTLVDWAVVVEKAEDEAYDPIIILRRILLGCVFGTAGVIILLVIPCAHLSVQPIRRLKYATEKSISPPGYEDSFDDDYDEENPSSGTYSQKSKKGLFATIRRRFEKRQRTVATAEVEAEARRHTFKIPGRVEDRKHFITDELTELTQTFNEMTDELLKQYTSLDEKVAERTRELEISKKAAEAANESKTLFIANISHELKTPLNGIMGMCAVCMEEDDIERIKQSLKTLYRSGDLLLHLLEDLLSFSKNQIGQQVSLEQKEFSLSYIKSQMLSIFDKQVRESMISFSVTFVSTDHGDADSGTDLHYQLEKTLPALGPPGMGRLKDMCLWGDQHRILQVLINLVSNSLKFTPVGGRVELRIKCIGELDQVGNEGSRSSSFGTTSVGRSRHRNSGGSTRSASSKTTNTTPTPMKGGTALSINPLDSRPTPHIRVRERSPTPPPANAKLFMFEFEVEDTGPGIPEHMQDKIFEPFVQGDLGLSKKFGGTGLGLSICSQLAKLMGGSIDLKSTVDVGSTFTMRIPIKYVKDCAASTTSSSTKSRPPSFASTDGDGQRVSVTKPAPVQKANGKANGKPNSKTNVLDKQPRLVGLSAPFFGTTPNSVHNKGYKTVAIDKTMANGTGDAKFRVLVADDNSVNVEVVSRMLKLEDVYDVTIAKDGQEAYELVKADMEKNQTFDVIFMDIQMPNLDGLQSTRLIRKMGYMAPIVALTAFSEESNIKECIESGMNEFLSKPIRRPALKQVLKKFATIIEEPELTSPVDAVLPDPPPPTAEPVAT
ncbi:histidine kinase [Drechmeria coniospora]|uniref:histidine kinase n=1 Tax=Drechmeria coniospora TaxID=98403 RepID=A0A151GJW2_DRECN|nr:histidine kinase [Drechmeria coniospora]KYK57413.1 histidine kinase [Drechmeria coniospora]